MPVTSAISVSTISSSMRVTPESLDRLPLLVAPANNVCVVPFSARLPVGAERNNVGLVTVLAGELIKIRMAPNVRRRVLRQIRTGPLIDSLRLHAQAVQAHLGSREIARVQFVRAQRRHKRIDLRAHLSALGLIHIAEQF